MTSDEEVKQLITEVNQDFYDKYYPDYEKEMGQHGFGVKSDDVTCPRHYMGVRDIDCKDAMESCMDFSYMMGFWWGCAFKYLWRWREKGGVKDLRKCKESINNLIAMLEDNDA